MVVNVSTHLKNSTSSDYHHTVCHLSNLVGVVHDRLKERSALFSLLVTAKAVFQLAYTRCYAMLLYAIVWPNSDLCV